MLSLSERVMVQVERVREKNLHRWTSGYARWLVRSTGPRLRARLRPDTGPRHLLFAFCDHYEPLWESMDRVRGRERVRAWHEGYLALVVLFRDVDGYAPH